jgi:hypothetical protein
MRRPSPRRSGPRIQIALDLLDAIDPTLTENQREEAALRAIGANPQFAAGWLLRMLGDTYHQLADVSGVDVDELLLLVRRRTYPPPPP